MLRDFNFLIDNIETCARLFGLENDSYGLQVNMNDQDMTEFMDDDSNDATSPTPENDPTLYEEQATSTVVHNIDLSNTRTLGQPLSDFLMTLEDYTPTVGHQIEPFGMIHKKHE